MMLLADVIAKLPLCLQLMFFFCLADVIAMLLCCFRIDGDVLPIRLMFLALFGRCYSHTCGCWYYHIDH